MIGMRILYHHRTSAQDGSAIHIAGLVDALRNLGAEVLVVAPALSAGAGGEAKNSRRHWIQTLRRRLPRFAHEFVELAYNFPEAIRLWRAVKRFRPDVIYQRSNLYLLSGAWVARKADIPLIEEVNAPYFAERSRHGGIALPKLACWAERMAWCHADVVVTVTSVLASMVESKGVSTNRLVVMPNGVDYSLLGSTAVDPEAKHALGLSSFTVLGFTGYVREWNGLEEVIDLLAEPGSREAFLLIVGDGPARASLEARARDRRVSDRVRFTGVIGREEIPRYVSAFDVALQPAANPYASPLKLFEYMALKRAIVAPDQPNIREILSDETDALLFDPADPGALRSALKRLCGDSVLRARLAAGARRTLEQRGLLWDANGRRVLGLIDRLAGRRKSDRLSMAEPT